LLVLKDLGCLFINCDYIVNVSAHNITLYASSHSQPEFFAHVPSRHFSVVHSSSLLNDVTAHKV